MSSRGRVTAWALILAVTLVALVLVVRQVHRPAAARHLNGGINVRCDTIGSTERREVVITDAAGRTLATDTIHATGRDRSGLCSFRFSTDVPDTAVYRIQVGGLAQVLLTRTQLEAQGWSVDLTG